ncbi:MAG: ribosome silencing factor [Candidatus Edwardsbacteria bacterium]
MPKSLPHRKRNASGLSSSRRAILAAKFALTKKAFDVVILDLRKLSEICDFFVIASGNTDVQVRAIAEAVSEGLEKKNVSLHHLEGGTYGRWILLDFVDVIVHIFDSKLREYYRIEDLWGDAPRKEVKEK